MIASEIAWNGTGGWATLWCDDPARPPTCLEAISERTTDKARRHAIEDGWLVTDETQQCPKHREDQ